MHTRQATPMTDRHRGRLSGLAVLVIAWVLVLAAYSPALAHIKNEESQFPDIEGSPFAADIVLLVGLDVIPQSPVFEPDQPLTFESLAAWAALAHALGQGGETPDTEQLARAAVDQGLVPSLDGEATYADINDAIFEGALSLSEEDAAATPTRAEAAGFIAGHIATELDDMGTTLLTRLDAELGPTGTVDALEVQEGSGHGRTWFTIGDTTLPIHPHGRVAFGPTDLLQWEGLHVARSLVVPYGGERVLSFIEAGEPPQEEVGHPDEAAGNGEAAPSDEPALPGVDDRATGDAPGEPAEAASGPNWLLYGLIVALAVLAFVIFGRRRG